MTRRRDDAESEALEVVVRARGECQLVLAAVAGTGIDVTDGETSSLVGSRERHDAAKSA
jgi:hypothetical protein